MSKVTQKTRVQSSKGATSSGRGSIVPNPNKVEQRVQVLERENMMLRKSLNMPEILKEFKKSYSENDMQQLFFESLHDLQQKLIQYESGKGASTRGSVSDMQIDLDKERQRVKTLEQDVNEKNKLINEKDKDLKKFRTEMDLQKVHARHAAEAIKKMEKMQVEQDELNRQILTNQDTIKEQSDEIARLRKELSDTKRSTLTLQEEMSEIEKLRSELRENNKRQEEMAKTMKDLKKELVISQNKYREAEAIIHNNETTLKERNAVIKRLNEEKQAIDEQAGGTAGKMSELLEAVASHETTVQKMTEEKSQTEKKVKEMTDLLEQNKETIKSLELDRQKLVEENEEKDKGLEELQSKVNAKEKILDDADGRAKYSHNSGISKEEFEEKCAEINKLKEELSEAKRSIEKLKGEKDKLEFTCHEAFDKLNQKEKQMRSLEEEHKKKIDRKDETIQKLRRDMTMVDPTAGGNVKVETKGLVEKYEKSESELKQAKEEIDELKTRLSKVTGAVVMNGNPDITDLSDVNKPTRLAEKFSQVYDNEWTDAYEEVKKEQKTEERTVAFLHSTLQDVFDFCKSISEEHAKSLHACVLTVPYAANGRPKSAKIDGAKLRQLKELRKSFAPYLAESVFHHFVNTLKLNLVGKKKTELFIKRCVEVCWLMNAQDPPVVLDMSHDKDKLFDQDRYKSYTRSGGTVDFIVWPPVLLHKNGSLLCKGVAQGK